MAKGAKAWVKWLIVALGITGGAVLAMQYMEKGAPVLTEEATTAEIRTWVEERARTSLPRVYKMTMPIDGRVFPIEIEAGEMVKKGQLVASLDTTPLLAAKAKAKAALEINQFNELEQTAAIEFQRWIEAVSQTAQAAETMTKASDAQLKFSDWYTKSVEDLVKSGASPKERILRAEADNAQYKVNAAVNRLVAEAMNTIRIASELGPKYVDEWLKRKSLQTDALRQALAKAESDLQRAELRAPIDGVVLARHVENETALPAGAPLLDIGNLDALQITADILTQSAAPIRAGQEVDILGLKAGSAPVAGKVKQVKPEAFTKVSSLGVEQQRVPVIVSFDANKARARSLGLGYRLRVRIYTGAVKDATVVPRLAIFRDTSGQWQLFVVQAGKAALRQVNVGLMNDDQVQITNGVRSGEQVIVSPPKNLHDGDTVAAKGV